MAVVSASISVPEIIRGSNPGAVIRMVYSAYGRISCGVRLSSRGGASKVMFSVCPELFVVISSKVWPGSSVFEMEIFASLQPPQQSVAYEEAYNQRTKV